jgi:hypothetical protein
VFNAVRARRRRFFHLFVPAADGMSFFQAAARDGFTSLPCILTRGNISFLPCEDSAFCQRTLRSP